MAHGHAGGGKVHRAARVGAGDDGGAGAGGRSFDRGDLAGPHVAGERRLQRRVPPPAPQHRPSSSSSTTSANRPRTARTGSWARCTWRRWHGSWTMTGPSGAVAGGRRSSRPASHSWTSTTRAANACGGRRAQEVAVVLQRRPAPRRVDDDRRIARHRRHRALGEPPGRRRRARRGCAARRSTRRARPERGAGRLDDGARGPMGVAHPGVHHAPGVEPDGVAAAWCRRRDARPPPQWQAGQPSPLRDQPQALRDREHAGAGEEGPMPTEHRETRPQPARCGPVGVGQRLAGALHQVAERDATRARRLAAAALDARLHEPHELVVGGARRATGPPAWRRSGRAATAPPRP